MQFVGEHFEQRCTGLNLAETIEISLHLRGVATARFFSKFCKTDSRHALYIWLSALKDSPIPGMFTVYYVSSQCVQAQMRNLLL